MIAALLRREDADGTEFEFSAFEAKNEILSFEVSFETLQKIQPRTAQRLRQQGFSKPRVWMTFTLPHGDYEILRVLTD